MIGLFYFFANHLRKKLHHRCLIVSHKRLRYVHNYLHKKWSFPLRISSVNVKSFTEVTFTEEIVNGKLHFLCTYFQINAWSAFLEKKFGQKLKKKQRKFDKSRKLWYLLFRSFWLALPKINFWKKDRGLSCVLIQFWDCPNIFYFPSVLSLESSCFYEGTFAQRLLYEISGPVLVIFLYRKTG